MKRETEIVSRSACFVQYNVSGARFGLSLDEDQETKEGEQVCVSDLAIPITTVFQSIHDQR